MQEILDTFSYSLSAFLTFEYILILIIGVFIGIIAGALPGMGSMVTLTLILPFTFTWDPIPSFILMSAIMGSTTVGGGITAILINAPGTDSNIATTLDGYPMTKKGRAVEALGIMSSASLFGSLMGLVLLFILLPFLMVVSLAFGPPEIFWLGIFTLVILSTVTGGSVLMNFLIGGLGFLFAMIGMDPAVGSLRFTFDIDYLRGGIELIPALVGTFAISEMINIYVNNNVSFTGNVTVKGSRLKSLKSLVENRFLLIRSTIIGFIIGVIPGVGGTVANYLAYGHAVQSAKDKENFGKGDPRGVLAPESSNNAKDLGQLVPTFALGIPGSGTMAIFLGALILHGFTPGPSLMNNHLDTVGIIIIAFAFAFMASCLLVFFFGHLIVPFLRINVNIMISIILTICFIAIYVTRFQIIDTLVMLLFGILAYIIMKLKGSRILLILPLILGPIIENNFMLAKQISRGNNMIFLEGAVSITIILITVLSFLYPLYKKLRQSKSKSNKEV